MALRPQYGSRYFPPVIMFFSAVMMMVLPVLSEMASGFSRMLPFGGFQAAQGMFGIGTLSRLYFLGSFVHGFRTWRRMLHMELEENSVYEGPPLPIFRIIPGSFWMVRIIYEPVFLFTISLVLPNFFILQASAAHYLTLAAIMLALKNYVAWYKTWEFLRNMMDLRFAGPRIAKLVENQATEDDLAPIHLASFPKNLPDDVRPGRGPAYRARLLSRSRDPGARAQQGDHRKGELMNITKQQRKIILICLAVVVASYIVRSIVNFAQQQEYMRQQFMRAAQQQAKAQADAKARAKAKAEKDAADRAGAQASGSATASPSFQALTTVSNLTGTWKGQGALTGHGLCNLRLELRETHEAPGHYTGYSALSCLNIAPLMTPKARNKASAMQNRLNPAASILTGAPENGSIRFHVDTTINTAVRLLLADTNAKLHPLPRGYDD